MDLVHLSYYSYYFTLIFFNSPFQMIMMIMMMKNVDIAPPLLVPHPN
jgi:hypothetical protein